MQSVNFLIDAMPRGRHLIPGCMVTLFLIVSAGAGLLAQSALAEHAPAAVSSGRSDDAAKAASAGASKRPLESVLNPDGTLNTASGFSGSLDPAGWKMVPNTGGPPRFARTGEQPMQRSAPQTIQSPGVPGDENWDGRFAFSNAPNSQVSAIAV